MDIQTIPLKQIKRDERCQCRAEFDEDYVNELVEILENDQEFFGSPPVVFQDEAGEYWLADGFNRLEAYRRHKKIKAIEFQVYLGSFEDAVTYAHREANAHHGRRLTNKDLAKKITWHLEHPRYGLFSDTTIANWCRCSRKAVYRVRERLKVKIDYSQAPDFLDDAHLKQWQMLVEKGEKPQLHYEKSGALSVRKQVKDKPEAPEKPENFIEKVKKAIAKMDREKCPEERANRHIAEQFQTTPEVIAKIRRGEDPEAKTEEKETESNPLGGSSSGSSSSSSGSGNSRKTTTKGDHRLIDPIFHDLIDSLKANLTSIESIISWNSWFEGKSKAFFDRVVDLSDFDFNPRFVIDVYGEIIRFFQEIKPYKSCPECSGEGCVACLGTGVMPEHEYKHHMEKNAPEKGVE